jgi:hypothetical protein
MHNLPRNLPTTTTQQHKNITSTKGMNQSESNRKDVQEIEKDGTHYSILFRITIPITKKVLHNTKYL